jgi:hypothetical protein
LAAALCAGALLIGACGDDDEAADPATTAGDTAGTTADGDAGTTGEAAGDQVDVCELVSADDISEATGTDFSEGQPLAPEGSLLGGCDFAADDASMFVSVSARPADEYEGTVEASGNQEELDDIGNAAAWTDAGVLALFDDYMLHVMALAEGEIDQDISVAVAEAVDS